MKAHECDHFLNGCNHSEFLDSEVHCKQNIGQLQHKFEPQNLFSKIMEYLSLPCSPHKQVPNTPCYAPISKQPHFDNPYHPCRHTKPSSPPPQHNLHHTVSATNSPPYNINNLHPVYGIQINQIKQNPALFECNCLMCKIMSDKWVPIKCRFISGNELQEVFATHHPTELDVVDDEQSFHLYFPELEDQPPALIKHSSQLNSQVCSLPKGV
eukprot:jgi/Psemu1/55758/gm1.55758_g